MSDDEVSVGSEVVSDGSHGTIYCDYWEKGKDKDPDKKQIIRAGDVLMYQHLMDPMHDNIPLD
jgi:hypothetical protein